jgi:capsular polysaccharide biosynthesis protein
MLATADQRLIDSYAALAAAEADAAREARGELVRDFPRLYARFHGCVALAAPPRVEGPLRVGYVEGAAIPRGEHMTAEEAPKIRTVLPAQSHDAQTTFDAELSVGAGIPAFAQLADYRQWTSPAVCCAEFDNAWLHTSSGLVFTQRSLWCDASFATVLNPGGRARAIEFVALDGDFFRIAGPQDEEPLRLDRPAMVLASWASRANYGHWLANSLLSVYLALDRIQSGELALISPPLSQRQRDELLALGAPRDALIETARGFVRGPLVHPSPLSTSTNMSPGSWVSDFFPFLKQRLGAAGEAKGPRFVYLSRRKLVNSSRVMTNEGALIRSLVNLGFVCVDPQELDLAAQARLMARAEIVVGQFGAALWNLGFAPPGGVAVEISVDAYASNEYLFLAKQAGLRFIRVMASVDVAVADAARGFAFGFEAPIAAIVAIVRRLRLGG